MVSQFITLYITPVIYLYFEWFQERVLDRTSFFRSGHAQLQPQEAAPAAPGWDAGKRGGSDSCWEK